LSLLSRIFAVILDAFRGVKMNKNLSRGFASDPTESLYRFLDPLEWWEGVYIYPIPKNHTAPPSASCREIRRLEPRSSCLLFLTTLCMSMYFISYTYIKFGVHMFSVHCLRVHHTMSFLHVVLYRIMIVSRIVVLQFSIISGID